MNLFLTMRIDMISGVYKIENLLNGKVYIGQSKDISRRYIEHFQLQHMKKGRGVFLYNAMDYHGIENFSFQILKITYDLDYWERFFIYWYKSNNCDYGYNLTSGGQKGTRRFDDFVYTDEIKKKMSDRKKENWKDENYRIKMITSQKQGKNSESFHKNRSEATKRQWLNGGMKNQAEKLSNYWTGVKKSEETKLKMKESSRLRELKHSQDYDLYLSMGGELNRREFCKHYKKGKNMLLEEYDTNE